MSRIFLPLLLLFLTACDFDGPFNTIPCRYDLSQLHDTLKPYGLWSAGAAPVGFRSKSAYNPADLDTTSWDIILCIDTPNYYFFNEAFVSMLARKVFDAPANAYFRHLTFHLQQRLDRSGIATLLYSIDRGSDTTGLRKIPVSANARITKQTGEGEATAGRYGRWKTVTLEVDALPADAHRIAAQYHALHPQYRDVNIEVRYVPSALCRSVSYQFWFED